MVLFFSIFNMDIKHISYFKRAVNQKNAMVLEDFS